MAKCELSGKAPVVKNLVSHSNIKTKSRAKPNIQSKSFFSARLKQFFKFKTAASAVKSIDKAGGLDIFIVRQEDKLLSPKALRLKRKILSQTKKKKPKGKNESKN